MVKKLSTKYKVVIVNVMVIGLLLCGQYWIDQQNKGDTQYFAKKEDEAFKKFQKELDAFLNLETKVLKFEGVDGNFMLFDNLDSEGKFDVSSNGVKETGKATIRLAPEGKTFIYSQIPSESTPIISKKNIFKTKSSKDEENKTCSKLLEIQKYTKKFDDTVTAITKIQSKTFFVGKKYRVMSALDVTKSKKYPSDSTAFPILQQYKPGDEVEIKELYMDEEHKRLRVRVTENLWTSAMRFDGTLIKEKSFLWLEPIGKEQKEEEEEKIKKLQDEFNKVKKILQEKLKSFSFTTVDDTTVSFRYDTYKIMYETKAKRTRIIPGVKFKKFEFLDNSCSFAIEEQLCEYHTIIVPKIEDPELAECNRLQQNLQKRKMYKIFIWGFIVILVCLVIITVIFYDEEEKNFVFIIVKNENEFEDFQNQYTPDGASNL